MYRGVNRILKVVIYGQVSDRLLLHNGVECAIMLLGHGKPERSSARSSQITEGKAQTI